MTDFREISYQVCDPAHLSSAIYACLKNRLVFCKQCWRAYHHSHKCTIDKCGHIKRISHIALRRALEYKNSLRAALKADSLQDWKDATDQFRKVHLQTLQQIKNFLELKVPLLLEFTLGNLLQKHSLNLYLNPHRYDGRCSQLLRIINSEEQYLHGETLHSVLAAYHKIQNSHSCSASQIRQYGSWAPSCSLKPQLKEFIEGYKEKVIYFIKVMKRNIHENLTSELGKLGNSLNSDINLNSMTFPVIPKQDTDFASKQSYDSTRPFTVGSFGTVWSPDKYHGYDLDIASLEANTQKLLHVGQTFLKERLHDAFSAIQTSIKSTFSYKFANIIATTFSQDEQYQRLLLQLQPQCSAAKSLKVVLVGRDVIVVQHLENHIQHYQAKIFGYNQLREQYYQYVFQRLGLKPAQLSLLKIEFPQKLTDNELAYANLQIAHNQVFAPLQVNAILSTLAQQGRVRFATVVSKLRSQDCIHIPFDLPSEQVIKLLI